MEKFNAGMVVHIYNPSHDEALAINKAQYCPSSAARQTGEMFWDVAKWWMSPDDFILHLPTDGSLRGVAVPDWTMVQRIEPWGWDRHIVGVLRRLGAPDGLLPTEAQLDTIRHLSSRQTAVRVLEALRLRLPLSETIPASAVLQAESRWCTLESEVTDAVEAFGGEAMLKQPWSCSGRGVWRTTAADLSGEHSSSILRVRKTLREQGAVEVEPLYECVADFAMEFCAEADGSVRYEGLSVFATHAGGGYAGNVIAPQPELQRRLEEKAGGALPLQALAEVLCSVLGEVLAGQYAGPLGVDMMHTPEGIHPCIEVNLRNTMGRVAIFQQQFSPTGNRN